MTEGKLRMTIIAAAFALAAALTPAHTAAEIVVLPAEQRGRDLVLEFDARFAAGAPRDLDLRLGFAPPGRPDAQPADLRFSRTSISFAGNWTRTFDFIGSGYTGTPFMEQRRYLLPFEVPDGEWRHARVVADGGYVTFFVQFGDKLQRTLTNRLHDETSLAGYEFVLPKGVEVANVKAGPVADGDRPAPRAGYGVCRTPQAVDIPLTGGQASFSFIPGGYPVEIMLDFQDGSTNRLNARFSSFCESFNHYLYNAERHDKAGVEEFERGGFGGNVRIPDYGMNFTSGRANFPIYTYPKLGGRYGAVQIIHMMTNLTAYGEQASEHVFECSLLRRNGRNLLYVDGNYAATIGSTNPVSALALSLPIGGCWRVDAPPPAEGPDPRVVKIPDFAPFATAVCRENLGSFALECDGYLSRGAFERQFESFLRRIPIGTYVRAKVRCRLAGDTNANTKVTARLTNFYSPNSAGRITESITQQTVELPRDLKGETNVVFQFDAGKIQDVIWQRGFDYLDFEVLGDSNARHNTYDQGFLKPVGTSDVVVVAAELERAPAGMCVRGGNAPFDSMFLPHEEASVTAEVAALLAGRYRVAWEVTDIDGKVRESGAEDLDLAAGASGTRRIVFKTRTPGWYGVAVRLQDAQGRTILRHDTSYVSLAEDTRKAGYESPFYTWTPLRGHGSDRADFERTMDHARRLGIRKAQPGKFSEADAAPWGVTLSPLPFIGFSNKPTEAERIADYEKAITNLMARFPHATAATIFHESGNCRARNQPPDPAQDAEEIRKATELCRAWRRLAPQVKLVLGNGSIDKVAQILRNKFPRDLIDAMGEEGVGGVRTPEEAVGEVFQEYRDLADQYGYTDLPVTPCYEWKSRPARNFDSRRLLAAYCVRDALIALAWGAEHVTLEGGYEPDGSYFSTSWGAGAFSHRPYGYPYPTAAALATMTRALDRATYSRVIPTGSETVFAVEYRRAAGGFVTALWTTRGTVKAEVTASSRKVVQTGAYGEETPLSLSVFGKQATVEVCEEPIYLTTAEPLKGVAVLPGDRVFRFDRYPGIEKTRTVAPLDSLADVELDTNVYPVLTASKGVFTLREADDPVRGKCLELERDASNQGDAFGGVRFREPVLLDGKADTLGLWVKGNSSTGRVYFDIRDARGIRYYSTSQFWCYDWGGKMLLNYDGWRFISFPITEASPVRIPSHAPDLKNWRIIGRPYTEWSPPVPPVSLLGIGFSWGDTQVHVNERHPVGSDAIRLSAFGVY